MYKKLFYISFLLLGFGVKAQNITEIEYFFDADPGFGNATAISFTPATTVSNLELDIPVTSLSVGYHTLYIRAKDGDGHWGLTNNTTIYKIAASNASGGAGSLANITAIEYFFDTDPGYGAGTSLAITPGTNLDGLAFDLPVNSLSEGYHTLYIRAKDANSRWSLTNNTTIYKIAASNVSGGAGSLANITAIEYFFDTDPGFGAGTSLAITPGTTLEGLAFDLPVNSLSEGYHTLYIRAKDDNGRWGLTNNTSVYKLAATSGGNTTPQADITQVEYFIDTDPGYGSATQISISPAQKIEDIAFDLDVSGLTEAEHFIYVRAKDSNGKWSVVHKSSFSVCFGEVPVLNQPSNVNAKGFTTSWNAITGATSYLLDISRDNFETFESGYEGKELFINSETASNLEEGISYQVRVSAVTSCASVYSAVKEVSLPLSTPTSQARNLSFQNPTETGFQVSFTAASGNVTGYLVVRKEALSPTFVPANNTNYTVGDVVGDGVVAFNGSGLGFVETALTANTSYYYDIFAYNSNAELITYFTAEPLEGDYYTVGSEPTNQPSNLSFSSVSGESLVLNYELSTPADGFLITRRQNNASTFVPTDGETYTPGQTYDDIQVVYAGPEQVVKDSLLNQITRYYYTVFTFNGEDSKINYKQDNPLKSDIVTALRAPAVQPSALSFSNISNSGVDLAFTAAILEVNGYIVLRKPTSAIESEPLYNTNYEVGDALSDGTVIVANGLATSLNETTLAADTKYFYQIHSYAVDAEYISYNLEEPLSGSITTYAAEPAAQIANLALEAVTDSSATLSLENVNNGGQLLLTRTLASDDSSLPIDGITYAAGDLIGDSKVLFSGDTLSYRDDSIAAGTNYVYQAFAYQGEGEATNYNISIESNSLAVLSLPLAPSDIANTAVATTSFQLQLNTVESATAYLVDVSTDNFETYVAGYEATEVSNELFSVTGLTAGTNYQVRVKAKNASGLSIYSEVFEQQTLSLAPTGLTIEEVSQSGFVLRWPAIFGADNYLLDISKDDFVTFEEAYFDKEILEDSILVVGLEAGTNFQLRLRANNSAGASDNSTTVTQLLIPADPIAIDATNTTSSSFKAKWDVVKGAANYYVDVSLGSDAFDPPLASFTNIDAGLVNELLVTGLNPNTPYSYRVRSSNESGESGNSNVISLSTLVQGEGALPQFGEINFDATFTGANAEVSVRITSGIPPFEMTFFSRPIRGEVFQERLITAGAEQNYSTTLSAADFDEVGAEFYFEVKDGNGLIQTSRTNYIYNEVTSSQGNIPFTKSGGTLASYEFFSIPFEIRDNLIASVFEEMGEYVKSEWRLVRYQNGENVDYGGGINRIEIGKSYWFNQKGNREISFEAANTAKANQEKPFVLRLQPGWNQIATPYTFELNWLDVLAYNGNPDNIGTLKVYDGDNIAFINGSRLIPWSGAFVHNDNPGAFDIEIPVTFRSEQSRMIHREWNYEMDEKTKQWMLPIMLTQNGFTSEINAIGMHPEANLSKDWLDDIAVPSWGARPSMYVEHPSFFNPKFTRDIVPVSDEHEWNFAMFTKEEGMITFSWDAKILSQLSGSLWLYDAKRGTLINMAENNSYSINPDDLENITFSFGDDALAIGKHLVGKPYPNPARANLNLPIYIDSEEEEVIIKAYNAKGQLLETLYNGLLGKGAHKIGLELDADGVQKMNGLVLLIYQIGNENYSQRIIIKP